MYYLGTDIGGSAVKIVAADENGNILARRKYSADGSGEHLEREAKEMLSEAKIAEPPAHIFITGAGSDIAENLFENIPRTRFEEFGCFGRGAVSLSGIHKAVIVSIGTGTAFVTADGNKYTHIGGSGVGGGTLSGLAELTVNTSDSAALNRLISEGNPAKVDLTMGDICKGTLGGLAADVTAANFGSRHMSHSPADIAAGISNMIFQTAGVMAAFACKGTDITNAVFVGAMSEIPEGKAVLEAVGQLHELTFTVPEGGAYAGALGAILWGLESRELS
ncbi:MAG: BadF/BadG/BcrA/BcrD ATPase family protein [Huintestinicola sp.]